MSEPRRWNVNVGDEHEGVYEVEHESGDWVRFSDHARIVAELKAKVERLRTLVNTLSYRLEYGHDEELEAIEKGEGT